MNHHRLAVTLAALSGLALSVAHAEPLGTSFTYQGELQDQSGPATGTFDFEFAAYTQSTGGVALATSCIDDIQVADGRFTTLLDFGQLPSERVWIAVRVREGAGRICGDPTGFELLSPRQEITPTPFAGHAQSAESLNGRPASFYTNASNLSDGILPNSRLSPTVARTDIPQTFTGAMTFNNIAGNGAGLSSLNASNLSSGTVADTRLGANIPRLNGTNTWSGASNTFSGELYTPTSVVSDRLLVRGAEAGAFFSRGAAAPNFWKISTQANAGAEGDDLQFLRYRAASFDGIAMVIKNDTGRVGIGSTSPQATLDVNGQIYSRSGGIKFPDGSVQTSAVGPTPSPGAANGITEFLSNQTWVVPPGVTRVTYEMWGAGGGGAKSSYGGGGGGAGAYRHGVLLVAPGQSLTIAVGAGGATPSFGSEGAGTDGGLTSISVPGGQVIAADSGKGGLRVNINGRSFGGAGGGSGSGPTSIGRPGFAGTDNDSVIGTGGVGGEPERIGGLLPRERSETGVIRFRGCGGNGNYSGAGTGTRGRDGYVMLYW